MMMLAMAMVMMKYADDDSGALLGTCRSSWINVGSSQTLTFASGDKGRKRVGFTVGTVKPNLRVKMTYAAGDSYSGTLTLDSSKLAAQISSQDTVLQSGGVVGIMTLSSLTANATASNNASYSEVGYLYVGAGAFRDNSFTAVDQAAGDCVTDTNGYLNLADSFDANGQIGCYIGNTAEIWLGRFIPDHFDVSLNTPVFAPSCGTFSYMGQPIKYANNPIATVTAKNSAAITTQNYTGAFYKISSAIFPSYVEATQPLTVLNLLDPSVSDNGSGVSTLNFADTNSNILSITRPSSPINEFNADIALSFTLQDGDSVVVGHVNGSAAINPVRFGMASSGNGIRFTDSHNTQKWGRLVMGNVHGSEITTLSVPISAEYFNGVAFIQNTSDNCTSISLASQILLSNPGTSGGAPRAGTATMTVGSGFSTATLSNSQLLSGYSGISFSAPGTGNTGYINIGSNFNSLPWLLFPWNQGGTGNTSPSARATFGIYQGNPKIIYFREVY
jgi:hypothetical protein